MVLSSIGGCSKGPLYQAYCSDSEESSRDQGKGGSWEEEAFREEEEEENVGVFLATPRQGVSQECHLLGRHWRLSGCGN